MFDFSLITSLYRSDDHLALYLRRLRQTLADCALRVQVVVICNDATASERRLLDDAAVDLPLKVVYVPRETLYASWNRGVQQADAPLLAFWNVDDERTAAGIEAAHARLSADAELVDHAFEIVKGAHITHHNAQYDPSSLDPRTAVGPFFAFRRSLYERAGGFHPKFMICGDYEWAKRPQVRAAHYASSDVIAGRFVLHGGNLSGGTSPLEWVEFTIAMLWQGDYRYLRPVDPDALKSRWHDWAQAESSVPVPPEISAWLWGAGAADRYADYQRYRASIWQARWQTWRARLGLGDHPMQRYHPPAITHKPD